MSGVSIKETVQSVQPPSCKADNTYRMIFFSLWIKQFANLHNFFRCASISGLYTCEWASRWFLVSNLGAQNHAIQNSCHHVSLWSCQPVIMSACHHVDLSSYVLVSPSVCQHVNMSTCQPVNMSTCQHVNTSRKRLGNRWFSWNENRQFLHSRNVSYKSWVIADLYKTKPDNFVTREPSPKMVG